MVRVTIDVEEETLSGLAYTVQHIGQQIDDGFLGGVGWDVTGESEDPDEMPADTNRKDCADCQRHVFIEEEFPMSTPAIEDEPEPIMCACKHRMDEHRTCCKNWHGNVDVKDASETCPNFSDVDDEGTDTPRACPACGGTIYCICKPVDNADEN